MAGDVPQQDCGAHFVVPLNSRFRRAWDAVLITLLLYVATVMPYGLTFYEFHYEGDVQESKIAKFFSRVVDCCFWVDLFNGFVFSYEDKGVEVKDMRKIAVRYFKGYFILNLIACLPQDFLETVATLVFSSQASSTASRFHEVVRFLRLVRLARLVKLVALMNNNELFQKMQEKRGIRIVNFTASLLWFAHMSACVWYMVGYFEDDHTHTWVGRRTLADGSNLLNACSFEQWLTAMYWVLTVFTSVGFGDISALTEIELLFCSAVMLIGAVVNGIIVNEVINTITSIDDFAMEVSIRKASVKQFAVHTHLDDCSVKALNQWVESAKNFGGTYDRDAVSDLMMDQLPRELMDSLPPKLFDGELHKNLFVSTCRSRTGTLPPRFVLMLGLSVTQSHYEASEMLYQAGDHSHNIFLVMHGTFSYVAFRPKEEEHHEVPLASPPAEMKPHHHELLPHAATFDAAEMHKDLRTPLLAPSSQVIDRVGLLFTGEDHKDTSNAAEKETNGACSRYPYQLFSQRNYFGDVEVLLGIMRTASARSESPISCALVVSKVQMKNLSEEFPQYTGALLEAAKHREKKRTCLMNKNTAPRKYRHLAASILQQSCRTAGKRSRALIAKEHKIAQVITAAQRDVKREQSDIEEDCDEHPRTAPRATARSEGDGDTKAALRQLRDEVTAGNKGIETLLDEMRSLKELVITKVTSST